MTTRSVTPEGAPAKDGACHEFVRNEFGRPKAHPKGASQGRDAQPATINNTQVLRMLDTHQL